MAIVMHTIKGNQYAYNHHRVGKKVVCDYLGKSEKSEDNKVEHTEVTQQFNTKKDIKDYNTVSDFVKDNIVELKNNGITNNEDATELFISLRLNGFNPHPVSKDEAVDTILKNIPDSVMGGWFRNEDKTFKSKLVTAITKNDETRSAGLEIMRYNYNTAFDTNLSFNEFINTEITVYRGGKMSHGEFTSFSLNKHVAERFQKQYHTQSITELKIKPKDTLGSYQTTTEAEVLVPRSKL